MLFSEKTKGINIWSLLLFYHPHSRHDYTSVDHCPIYTPFP